MYGWLVGCFGFNGPLRQYFSLYRAVSQREDESGEKEQMRVKMSKQPPSAPTAARKIGIITALESKNKIEHSILSNIKRPRAFLSRHMTS